MRRIIHVLRSYVPFSELVAPWELFSTEPR
ncbi:unnamed protein product [Tetraodon nigroviridis]|uniref:(spotted green pufferfish) hypothetical protein n=1 Tax=Tetraodon nigroviridis TaxID=99883 RepID=Q4RJD7_TETNG|nr:unnamed protein product [Tetraodon nigroviridis]